MKEENKESFQSKESSNNVKIFFKIIKLTNNIDKDC